MAYRPDELAQELLIWRSRRSERVSRWPRGSGSTFGSRFAEHLSVVHSRRHSDDLRAAVRDFGSMHAGFADWYDAVLSPFKSGLTIEAGRPSLRVAMLPAWRRATARIDPDALITLRIAGTMPTGDDPAATIARLNGWGYYVGTDDHGLKVLLRRGLADTHVHFEASDPLPLLWLRLACGTVRARDLQFYSDAALSALREDPSERDRRRRDRAILDEAYALRTELAALVGHATHPDVPAARPPEGADLLGWLASERELLLRGWLAVSGSRPERATDAFDRYLFAKNLFLRRHQQRSGQGPGLSRFRDFLDRGETLWEKRTKKTKPLVRRARFERMLSLAAAPESLRILELRIAPQPSIEGWAAFFKAWLAVRRKHDDAWRGRDLKVRFVVHFIRQADGGRGPADAEFGALRRRIDRQSAVLHLFRHKFPAMAANIVGVDVANLERGCPPEVFAPYLALLRGSRELCGALEGPFLECWARLASRNLDHPPAGLPPLGLTYHAGEDFHHPVDGLRAIAGLTDNLLRPGDRIGHGLALGWDVARFERDRGPVPIPAGTLLDNLVWLRRECIGLDDWRGALRTRVDKAIEDLARYIYGESVGAGALERSLDTRFKIPRKTGQDIPANPAFRLAEMTAFDRDVARRRASIAAADVSDVLHAAAPLIPALQARLSRRILDSGLCVEANPSSNLATGAVDDLKEHPYFRSREALGVEVTGSINTDDPGVFGTDLEIEFGLMLAAMLERSVDRAAALRAIERSRSIGLEFAFARLGELPPDRRDER